LTLKLFLKINYAHYLGVLVLPNYVQKLVHLLEERCAGSNNNRIIQGRT